MSLVFQQWRMLSVRSYNSVVLTLPYLMVLLWTLTEDMLTRAWSFTVFLLCLYEVNTHTHTLNDKLEFVSKHHWQSNVFYVCFYLGWLFQKAALSPLAHSRPCAPVGSPVPFLHGEHGARIQCDSSAFGGELLPQQLSACLSVPKKDTCDHSIPR